jgi:glucose-6-phosphate dehydrogenase assembly protein OpcA
VARLNRRCQQAEAEVARLVAQDKATFTDAVALLNERDLARKSFAAIASLNASYVAAWKEVTSALGQPEAGDQTSDVDRVLKAIRERDEAVKALAEARNHEYAGELKAAHVEVKRLQFLLRELGFDEGGEA